jgi:hypothetical protein
VKIMPLFTRGNPELTDRENLQVSLAHVAGTGAGLGIGTLASYPLDARYQNRLLENAKKAQVDNEMAKKHWITLLQLERRQITLNDLPANDREFYSNLWKENSQTLKELASDPLKAKRALEAFDRKVIPIGDNLPKVKMTKDFAFKVRSPQARVLLGGLGLAGLIAGGKGAEKYFLSRKEEPSETNE